MGKNKTWKKDRECWLWKDLYVKQGVREDLSKKANHLNKEVKGLWARGLRYRREREKGKGSNSDKGPKLGQCLACLSTTEWTMQLELNEQGKKSKRSLRRKWVTACIRPCRPFIKTLAFPLSKMASDWTVQRGMT